MTENTKINDEMMANVNGGTSDDMYTTIKGIVMVDPYPDGPQYAGVYDECMANGYSVYELADGKIAVAKQDIPPLPVGDKVYVRHIRGYYGYEIEGVVDGK